MICSNQHHKRKEVKWRHNSSPGGMSSTMVGVAATTQHQHKKGEAKMRSSSQQEVAAQWINWRCQLCNGQSGSDKDNGNANDNDDVETTSTTTTTTMAAGSV
jgi:hypothetical protein